MKTYSEPIFSPIHFALARELAKAPLVDVGEWQAQHGDIPQGKTREVQDVIFEWPIPVGLEMLQLQVKPNLPWAEDHFQERVSGLPFNPPPSHEHWPFAQNDNKQHRKDQVFSHTYPERFWPKHAGDFEARHGHLSAHGEHCGQRGIRYRYGDLNDVLELLRKYPFTRQANLPVWFPEDTGAAHGERVPCSLGYHFLIRNGRLSCRYIIRSCDFLRHFRDDVYMAARLTQWVANEVGTTPGNLVMLIGSLHVFDGEEKDLVPEVDYDISAYVG